MGPAALPIAGIILASGSLGYGVYAGERAAKSQANAIANANKQAQDAKNQQAQQYQDQLKQEQETRASNLAQEAQTKQETQAAQQQALDAERAAIGTNSQTLSDSLVNQNLAAMKKQQPLLEGRLNALGLLQSGALPEGQAKYQADLQAQADSTLANYQIGAQGQLTQNTNAASANQVNLAEQNALLNIQNQQQNMAQNFATNNINNQNNTAYEQYLTSLKMGQSQSQQSAANSYTGLAGGIGSGLLNYYGGQNSSNPAIVGNPSLDAFYAAGYGSGPKLGLGSDWNGGTGKYLN